MSIRSWWDYADYHYEPGPDRNERPFSWAERTCVARLMRSDHSGENRFYVAPAADGTWFAWSDWHGRADHSDGLRPTLINEEADDATYTFADGGAFSPTHEAAMAAIYRWIQRDLVLELQRLQAKDSV